MSIFRTLCGICVFVLAGCSHDTKNARPSMPIDAPARTAVESVSSVPKRNVIRLDGVWQVAQGDMNQVPANFDRTIAVPGVLDMVQPAFEKVGTVSELRKAFWYRTKFSLPRPVPAAAILKIHKAQFGKKVYVNGRLAGEHLPCFTPAYFDLTKHLKGEGAENELVIRIGANPQSLPDNIPW